MIIINASVLFASSMPVSRSREKEIEKYATAVTVNSITALQKSIDNQLFHNVVIRLLCPYSLIMETAATSRPDGRRAVSMPECNRLHPRDSMPACMQ